LGLRYQINHGWNEVKNNMSSFDPTIINPATNTPGAYWFGSTHANGRNLLAGQYLQHLAPRLASPGHTIPRPRFGAGLDFTPIPGAWTPTAEAYQLRNGGRNSFVR